MQFSENDQAKPDLFSRLACSTLLSKILAALRLGGTVWIEAWLTPSVLELVALAGSHSITLAGVFCANPLNISNFHSLVKLNLFSPRPFQLTVGGVFLACEFRSA
jgi:hypothetical protein